MYVRTDINFFRLSSASSTEAKPSPKGLKKIVQSVDSLSKKGPKKSLSQDGSTGATDARPGPPYEKKKPLTKAERRELQVSGVDKPHTVQKHILYHLDVKKSQKNCWF